MLAVEASADWQQAYPGAVIGLLELSGVMNSGPAPGLAAEKRAIEVRLRADYAGYDRARLRELPVLGAYHRYYREFGYTYHVQLQLESLVHKGKPLPSVSPLVDANFAAELQTLILTAGHDADRLQAPLVIDLARAGETFTPMGGERKAVPERDMVMRDGHGIICSILRGQDDRSPITETTTHVLYVCYAPPGVAQEQVRSQLEIVRGLVRSFSPDMAVEQSRLLIA